MACRHIGAGVRYFFPHAGPRQRRFTKTYYGPNNATVAIVGDINPKEVIALIEGTFGNISVRRLPFCLCSRQSLSERGERLVEINLMRNRRWLSVL